tara:strand:- start:44 stop:898 length:855 start_codon:yes stop_codon:yes gene_type:complete
MKDPLLKLAEIINKNKIDCKFKILEIGALQIENSKPRFYKLLEYFPLSEIIGFEIEKNTCDEMNSKAAKGIKYYPHALGEKNERRKLYITEHPMCTSLYKPIETIPKLYQNLQFMNLKKETEIETITLDTFAEQYSIEDVDFIKIDVQGAELDIFKGGKKLLKKVLKIVCEVEFIPLYQNQPLFADVTKFLNQNDFMFNKFVGIAGRTLKPTIFNNDPNIPSQLMWSDAIFIKQIEKIQTLSNEKLLKLSLLAAVYNSLDLTFFCLSIYDKNNSTTLGKDLMSK